LVALWDKTNLHAHNNTSGTRPIMKKKQGVSRELNVFIIMRTNTILRYFNSVYDRAVERIIPDCHHSLQNKSIFSNSVIVYSFFFFFFIGTRSLYFNQCLLQNGSPHGTVFCFFTPTCDTNLLHTIRNRALTLYVWSSCLSYSVCFPQKYFLYGSVIRHQYSICQATKLCLFPLFSVCMESLTRISLKEKVQNYISDMPSFLSNLS